MTTNNPDPLEVAMLIGPFELKIRNQENYSGQRGAMETYLGVLALRLERLGALMDRLHTRLNQIDRVKNRLVELA